MDGGQDAAHQIHRGHGQGNVWQPEGLDDLGGVTVTEGGEGAHNAAALRVVRAGVAFCAAFGRTDFDLHDDRFFFIQQTRLRQGQQGQDAGGGVTAHATDIMGAAQSLPL